MKLFQEKPQVQQFANAADFVKEYGIGKGDFILVSKSIYNLSWTVLSPLDPQR